MNDGLDLVFLDDGRYQILVPSLALRYYKNNTVSSRALIECAAAAGCRDSSFRPPRRYMAILLTFR